MNNFDKKRPNITITEIRAKLAELPRDSTDRALIRMLSLGMRTSEIAIVAEIDERAIRHRVQEMFPQINSIQDFRRLFGKELAEDVSRDKLCYLMDHQSLDTAEKFKQQVSDISKIDSRYEGEKR